MVADIVKKIMTKAINNLAQVENVSNNEIQLMAHIYGQCEIENDKADVLYFYCSKGVPIREEDGKLKYLHFTKDILLKKFDTMAYGHFTKDFLRKKLNEEAQKHNKEVKALVIVITQKDGEIFVKVFDTREQKTIKEMTLEEVLV
jgi:hypothetical protein